MLSGQRHEAILSILEQKGAISVTELTELLDSSESTIRRDLIALQNKGMLSKVHGGATLTKKQFVNREDDIDVKSGLNVDDKRLIAQYAASQIRDDDFVYLDAGTTTYLMVEYITAKNVTFVTNGIMHGKALVKAGYKTIILGGELKKTTEAIIGLEASRNLQNYNFSKAFLGANGIAIKQGFTTPDPDEAFLKAAAIERSFVTYILAHSSKFNCVSTVTFAPLSEAAIITDTLPDKTFSEKTVVKEVK